MVTQPDRYIKLMLLGDSQVGKTCLLSKLKGDQMPSSHIPTIGIDVKMCSFQVRDRTLKVQVWDTAGQEKLRTIPKMYYAHSEGFVLVYDITDADTFRNIGYWVEQIRTYKEDAMKLLIGNKSDLESLRRVSTVKGQELAHKIGVDFIETSALTGDNVNEAFSSLAAKLTLEKQSVSLHEQSMRLTDPPNTREPRSGCCG
jgi:Ras-related protein Rab-1A